MEKNIEQRVNELEKKVATLEGQVQKQLKEFSVEEIVNALLPRIEKKLWEQTRCNSQEEELILMGANEYDLDNYENDNWFNGKIFVWI